MTKELATLSSNPNEINSFFGFDSSRPKPLIPLLRINGSDDGEGTSAPKGTYVYDDGSRILYAKEIGIRVYTKAYQYRLFHPTDKVKNDVSIIANTFRAEFRSMSGRIACGKLSKAAYSQIISPTEDQKFFQDNVKCKLVLFGVVSGVFTDLDTKAEVELVDELFVFTSNQSSFMELDTAVTSIGKERRAIPLTPIRMKLNKGKNGAVVYYTAVPEVLNMSVEFNKEKDGPYIEKIKKYIVDTNTHIENKYSASLASKSLDNDFGKLASNDAKSGEFLNDPLEI